MPSTRVAMVNDYRACAAPIWTATPCEHDARKDWFIIGPKLTISCPDASIHRSVGILDSQDTFEHGGAIPGLVQEHSVFPVKNTTIEGLQIAMELFWTERTIIYIGNEVKRI